ncbi:hypothetical protein EBR57_00535, partial [bacterium]|nr:hypothetical protein [bacterium]
MAISTPPILSNFTPQRIDSDTHWEAFWDRFGITMKQGPLVGLINSLDDRRPTAVVAITTHSVLWISELRTKPVAKILTLDGAHNRFLLGNKSVPIQDLIGIFEKLMALITDYRVGWLRLAPRSKSRNSIGRNVYWDKIADSLAEKIEFSGEAEIISIGSPQHLILNGILDGLSRLRRCAVFLSTVDPTLPWVSLLEEKSPLDQFTADTILDKVFSKATVDIVNSGKISISGKLIPVDVVYDLYCEFTQVSIVKRIFGKLDARWFGVATSSNDDSRQFFWLSVGITFDQFVQELIKTVDTLVADLSISQFMTIADRANAIPVTFLPITSDETKERLLAGLIATSHKIATILGFVEWNCELFSELKTAKRLLSDTSNRIDYIIRTLQTSEKPSDTLAGQIESTRSRIQFSIHLISERIAEIHSQVVLDKLSEIVTEVEQVIRQN